MAHPVDKVWKTFLKKDSKKFGSLAERSYICYVIKKKGYDSIAIENNRKILTMYKIKEKYKKHIARYASTKLDINGTYSLEVWKANGFHERILEESLNK